MSAIAYPSSLPGPSSAVLIPSERRLLSDLPGTQSVRGIQRDYLATQQLEWDLLDAAAAAALQTWWQSTIVCGMAWFAATWPLPAGWTSAVRRFLAPLQWTHLPGGFWRVTGACELRGRGELPQVELAHWLSLDGETPPVRVREAGTMKPWVFAESFLVSVLCPLAGGTYFGFGSCSISLESEGAPLLDTSGNNREIVRHPSNATMTTTEFGAYAGSRAIGNHGAEFSYVGWWVEVSAPMPVATGQWRVSGAIRTLGIASGIFPFMKQNGAVSDGTSAERPPLYIWFSTISEVSPLHLIVEGWASTTEHWMIDVVITRAAWSFIEVERGVDDGGAGFVGLKVDGVLVGAAATLIGTGGGEPVPVVGNFWIARSISFGSELLSNAVMDAIDIFTAG